MTHKLFKNHALRYAADEFNLAYHAYQWMAKISVGDFVEFEKQWREFLRRIDRIWNKTQAAVYNMPNWQKIQSEIVKLRKEDPLLIYLHQARNAEEHSILPSTKNWEAELKAQQKDDQIELSWKEWDYPLLPVKNRNQTYHPPKTHLGKNIEVLKRKNKAEPVIVAEFALEFYCNFLNRVSNEVVGGKRDF